MKTKISRIGKKSLSVIIALMMIVSTMLVGMVSASAVGAYDNGKFKSGDKIYFNFSATGATEVNVLDSGYPDKDYYSNSEFSALTNKTVECTLTKDLDLSKFTARLYGLKNGNWSQYNNNPSILPSDGQNMVVIAADGKSYKWDTYGGSTTNKYTVTYGSNNDSLGTVSATTSSGSLSSGSPQVDKDTEVTFTAKPTGSNEFKGWFSDSTCNTAIEGATSTTYTTTITKNTTVYAKFEAPTSSDKITVYFKNTGNWSNVYCYAWYNNGTADKNTTDAWPGNTMTLIDSTNKVYSIELPSNSTKCIFNQGNDAGKTGNLTIEAGKIFIYDSNATNKGKWEVYSSSTTKGAFAITDETKDINGSLSISATGKESGTADKNDTVTITGNPVKSYFVLDKVTVKGADNSSIEVSGTDNTRTFTMPEQNVTVKATFKLNKSAYMQSLKDAGTTGLFIDVAPNEYDTTATLIARTKRYTGDTSKSKSEYYFYLPKNVDLSDLKIYSSYGSAVTIKDKNGNTVTIPSCGYNTDTISLAVNTSYTPSGGTTESFRVMQGSTNAMFLYTTQNGVASPLPTTKSAGTSKKDVVRDGGVCKTMTNETSEASFSSAMALESVKGRGNSSWKASNDFFGKYAFNMKLAKKTNLFNIDTTKLPDGSDPSGSKSYCLLANNADESMMRNALTYQLASEIGLLYSPEFRFVDIYDNGEYLGQYLVTEKVDIGSSKLIKGKSFEDINEDAVKAQGGTDINKTLSNNATYSFTDSQGKEYSNLSMRYATVGTNTGSSPFEYNTTGKYLLEFEISERVNDEPCYFVSPQGQNVVLKNPEYATKEQVEFIAKKFAKMEEVAFTANASKTDLSAVMDVESFAKMYLIQEFTANLDAASTSYYVTFDCSQTNPVFVANPVWDYDMALGQFEKENYKYTKDGKTLSPAKTDAWLAKYKRMDNSESKAPDKYSIQSQLASQNSAFKTEIRNQWEGTNGFYANIQKYIGDNGQIKTWFDKINASAEMNEARWGFIASDLLTAPNADWGLKDTGANHTAAVNYLNTWVNKRAEWLNGEFKKDAEYPPYTPVPSLDSVSLTANPTEVTVGDSITLTATVAPSTATGVTYTFYQNNVVIGTENTTESTMIVTPETAGEYVYHVVATDGINTKTSKTATVTVNPLTITGVELTPSKTTVTPGAQFTLTPVVTPSSLTGVTYTFYQSTDDSAETTGDDVEIKNVTNNVATVTASETPGDYYYYVVATDANGNSIPSSIVTVKVKNESTVIENVTIRFKGTTLSSLIPYMSVDGGTAAAMTRSTDNPIGTHLSGAYRFVWFEATIPNVTVGQSKTLTFTTSKKSESTMNASITLNFTTLDDNVIYLAVDNMMSGTTAVDITNNNTAKTTFGSAMNMIKQSSASDPVATTLLSTMLKVTSASGKVTTKRYYLGDLDSDNKIGIKDATEIQKSIAGISELGAEYQSLGDFNADGVVDIKDATAIQKYIAGF